MDMNDHQSSSINDCDNPTRDIVINRLPAWIQCSAYCSPGYSVFTTLLLSPGWGREREIQLRPILHLSCIRSVMDLESHKMVEARSGIVQHPHQTWSIAAGSFREQPRTWCHNPQTDMGESEADSVTGPDGTG